MSAQPHIDYLVDRYGRLKAPPEPGYYVGVPFEEYHAWAAVSSSWLGLMDRSPAHLDAYLFADEDKDTETLVYGRAYHAAILEKEVFDERYAQKGDCSAVTSKGTPCRNSGKYLLTSGEHVCGTHLVEGADVDTSRTLLTPGQYNGSLAMRRAVLRKERAKKLLDNESHFELSIVWHREIAPGVWIACKARLDSYTPHGGGVVVDLKGTPDARRDAFEKSIFRYGYNRQVWWYREGALAVGLPAAHVVILAIEKERPWESVLYRVTEGALDAGQQMGEELLRVYGVCYETKSWGGYPDVVQEVALPDWAWKQIDERLEELRG